MTSTLALTAPIPDSYWVIPGRLLAGEYPGAKDAADAVLKLGRFPIPALGTPDGWKRSPETEEQWQRVRM